MKCKKFSVGFALLALAASGASGQTKYSITELGTRPGTIVYGSWNDSIAYGINNKGQVAGVVYSGNPNVQEAFLYSGGAMTGLGTLGSSGLLAGSVAFGILLTPIPEPKTWGLLAFGTVGLLLRRRKNQHALDLIIPAAFVGFLAGLATVLMLSFWNDKRPLMDTLTAEQNEQFRRYEKRVFVCAGIVAAALYALLTYWWP